MIYIQTLSSRLGEINIVTVVFYNLLRSKYNIEEELVKPGSIHQIIEEILTKHKEMKESDFRTCVVFRNNEPLHYHGFSTLIEDGERIIITHFVGGG